MKSGRNDNSGRRMSHNLLPGCAAILFVPKVSFTQPLFDTLLRDTIIVCERCDASRNSLRAAFRRCYQNRLTVIASTVLHRIK